MLTGEMMYPGQRINDMWKRAMPGSYGSFFDSHTRECHVALSEIIAVVKEDDVRWVQGVIEEDELRSGVITDDAVLLVAIRDQSASVSLVPFSNITGLSVTDAAISTTDDYWPEAGSLAFTLEFTGLGDIHFDKRTADTAALLEKAVKALTA